MKIQITQSTNRYIASPAKAQFISSGGLVWRLLAGDVAGAWVATSTVEQSETLTADIDVDTVSNIFTVSLPAGINAEGNPRYVLMHIYASGTTDSVAFASWVDLLTGMLTDPFFSGPSDQRTILDMNL